MSTRLNLSRNRSSTGKPQLDIDDRYKPFDRQKQFHNSQAKYRLFGGAAGPGKTKALLWEAIYQARRVPGSDGLLLRRTYGELESSLLAQFRRDVPRAFYKKFNESKHVVTWPNGSTTRFGYCRNENDVYQYQGAEFLFIGLDELTHFTLKQWQFLTSRNRCPVAGSKCSMAGATNPGNIGHAWVKSLWVDHKPPAGFEQTDFYNPNDYEFIRAWLSDNPIYANDADYRHTLEVLPEHLRKAFLDGDWNVFAGQYFNIFDYGRHTARPEEIRLEPWMPRWISIDWGFQHPSAVYWHCAVPTTVGSRKFKVERESKPLEESSSFNFQPSTFNSRIITYREFVQNGLSPRMLAQGIAERSGRENISEVFLSPDAFAHRTAEASIAEQLGDVLITNGLPRPAPADDDRIGGWQFMYQMLESNAWVITENCTKLIECMPTLVRDITRSEDIRKMDGDDPADAARYGLVSGGRFAGVGTGFTSSRAGQPPPLHPPGSGAHFVTGMPLAEQIARQVSATDPTSQAIHYQRLQAEARKQFRPKPLPRRHR
jgi:phage terminase large subunit